MTVVLDTNVALTARVTRHPNCEIVRGLAAGRFVIAMSTAISLEYTEIITARAGPDAWRQFAAVLDLAARLHDNVLHVEPSFRWRLITADPDDDKFADCAIAAEADWIITEDAHFEVLKSAGHKPQPIAPAEFIARQLMGNG